METDDERNQRSRFARVRLTLADSPLVRAGGAMITQLVDDHQLDELRRDATMSHPAATESFVSCEAANGRSGDPERWLESAPGRSSLNRYFHSAKVLNLLKQVTGVVWKPAGTTGSWSYYRRDGHHLGLHRDIAVCDLAVITCVVASGDDGSGGALELWPTRSKDELNAIRQDPWGSVRLKLTPGDSVILLGGFVPHRVLAVRTHQIRIVAPLCYSAVG